ncbi:MAG: MFS transporter [Candidatus Symbiodolus clandestinus]
MHDGLKYFINGERMDNSPSGDYRITGLLGHTGPEKKYLLAQLCVCVALCFGSFIDEAAQVTFSLHLADDASSVSALLSAGVFGALLAGPLSPRILYRIGPLKSISLAFIVQSLLITGASLVNQFIAYLIVAVALGCTGSIFWSAIMVAVPSFAQQDCEINRINRVMQAVRNCGHVGGPALGGVLYALAEGSQGMLLLALLALFAALITLVCFKILHPHSYHTVVSDPDNSRKGLDLIGLLRTNGVIHAFSPLIITIILTSMLNVLLIIRVRNDLKRSAEIYGLIVSMLSVGLVLGPLTLSGLFNRFSDAASASMAAAVMGCGILWLANTELTWHLMTATFLIGCTNGLQNTFMSSFIMKAIDKERRIFQIPTYILILQTAVFIGFFGAGFIKAQNVSGAFVFIGMITLIIGIFGFAFNISNKISCEKGTK